MPQAHLEPWINCYMIATQSLNKTKYSVKLRLDFDVFPSQAFERLTPDISQTLVLNLVKFVQEQLTQKFDTFSLTYDLPTFDNLDEEDNFISFYCSVFLEAQSTVEFAPWLAQNLTMTTIYQVFEEVLEPHPSAIWSIDFQSVQLHNLEISNDGYLP